MKRCLVVFLILILSGIVFPLNISSAKIQGDILKIGVYNNPPKLCISDDGKATGYHIEIIDEILRGSTYTAEFIPGTWEEGLSRLKKGEIDIMPDVAWSEKRNESYDFNDEYVLLNWACVYSSKSASVEIIPDLDGKRVAVMRNSIHTEGESGIINQVKNYGISCDFVFVDTYQEAFDKLENGNADAAVVNRLFGLLNEERSNVVRTSIIFNPSQIRYAFRKGVPENRYIIKLFDSRLKELKSDRESVYYGAFDRYLLPQIAKEKRFPRWSVNIIISAIVISIILGIYLLSFRSGKRESALLKNFFRHNRSMQDIRVSITDHALSAFALFSVPMFLAILYHGISIGWNNIIWLFFVSMVIPAIATIYRNRIPVILKVMIIFVSMFFTGILVLITWGRIGTGLTFFLTAGTIISLVYGKRAGLGVITLGLVLTAIFGILTQYKILIFNYDMLAYSRAPSSWAFAIMALFVMFFTIISGIEKFYENLVTAVDNLEQKVRERTADLDNVNKDLQKEIETRSSVEAELVRTNEQLTQRIEIQERAEKALAESEKKYRDLVESANSIIIRWRPDGIITFFNTYAQGFFGFTLSEIIGKNIVGTIVPAVETSGRDLEQIISEIGQNATVHAFNENENVTKDGEKVWISWTNKTIVDESGSVMETLSVGNDITLRKQMEESLKKTLDELSVAKERAEAADRTKSAFLASMTHEIRTPLNAILGYSQIMLREKKLPAGALREIGIINSSGEHLLGLINEILDMSKIEAGKIEAANETFSLCSVMRQVENLFSIKTGRKEIGFVINISDEVPEIIKTDKSKLKQIIINLAGNAIKFTDKGTVTVNVSMSDDDPGMLIFSVTDTGRGIPVSDIDNIFVPFEQTEEGKSRGGTGLGLPISREYARLLGGDLTVKSTLGKGSCFTFTIKYQEGDVPVLSEKYPVKKIIGIRNGLIPRVLIVDDRDVNREILVRLLEPLGFPIKEASGGREAMELIREWEPDLVLLDLVMPGMSGREVIKEVRANRSYSDIKIIVITASVLEIERDKVFELGADSFIKKPFREDSVLNEISDIFGIEYNYLEDENISDSTPVFMSGTELSEALSLVPEDIRNQLESALITGDIEDINNTIEKISSISPELAGKMKYMADDFEFSSLLDMLKIV